MTKNRVRLILLSSLILFGLFLIVKENSPSSLSAAETGLNGYWTFDNNSTADYSGNSNAGNIVGTPSWSSGKIGQAITFDDSNDRLDLAQDPIGATTMSVCSWIKPVVVTGTLQSIASNHRFIFGIHSTGNRLYVLSNNSGPTLYSADNALSVNTWQHVCVVRNNADGGPANIYIDGEVSNSGNSGTPVSGYGLSIGNDNAGSAPFKGSIDELKIFNRALTPVEIRAVFQNRTSGSDITPPTSPQNLTSSNIESNRATISWTASTDDIAMGGYRVLRNGVNIGTTTMTTFTDVGITPNTTYSYIVEAFDVSGNSAASVSLGVTTLEADISNPTIVNLRISPFRTSASVSFETNEPTRSKIEYGLTPAYGSETALSALETRHTFLVEGLQADSQYYYRITSTDSSNNTTASSSSFITSNSSSLGEIIPDERRVDWTNVGIPGGIPPRDNPAQILNVKNVPFNAGGSALETTGSIESGSNLLRLPSAAIASDFQIGQDILVISAQVERSVLTIESAAVNTGTITIELSPYPVSIQVVSGESAVAIAGKIRSAYSNHWVMGGTGNVVTFESRFLDYFSPDLSFSPLATGVRATAVTTQQGQGDLLSKIVAVNSNVLTLANNSRGTIANSKVVHDDTHAIQTAIDSALPNQVVYLPEGTYRISNPLTLNKSYVTLRGAGKDQTIITADTRVTRLLAIGNGTNQLPPITIQSGYTKGSNQLTFSSPAAINTIAAGDYLMVTELNDPSIPVTPYGVFTEGSRTFCTFCSDENGTGERLRGQYVRVTSKVNSTLTIDPPMFYNFSSNLVPAVRQMNPLSNVVEYSGVEDLTIKNGPSLQGEIENANIIMHYTAFSWIKNVKIEQCGSRCIYMWVYNYRNEIKDNLITRCITRFPSNQCYGTVAAMGATGNIIENNIYDGVASGVILAWAASAGNVVSYNYLHDVHRTQNTDGWFWSDMWTHGAHTSYNLWEGNTITGMNGDFYWGSHSHNTIFRNRMTGKESNLVYSDGSFQNNSALQLQKYNRYYTVMGNVLGTPSFPNMYESKLTIPTGTQKAIYITGAGDAGDPEVFNTMLRSCNFDYFTNSVKRCGDAGEPSCQGATNSCELPASLYLSTSTKPAWFGSVAFPPIGPDVIGKANKIPAQVCFERGEMPNCLELDPQNISHTLSVSVSGLGAGVVRANQDLINCGTNATICTYNGTSTITLNAAPLPNSTFNTWGGVCQGIASTSNCTVTLNANKSVTANFVVNTPSNQDEIPPVFLGFQASTKTNAASIKVNTDEAVSSVLSYGLTTGYGNITQTIASVGTTTSFSLSGLQPNTTYHYRVVATDASGNVATSTTRTFVTLSGTTTPVDIIPPTITITSPSTPVVTLVGKIGFSLAADASDNVGVVGVRFYVDGVARRTESTQFPYGVGYTTLGSHTVFAVARDLAGNQATSTTVSFRIERATTTISVETPIVIGAGGTGVVTRGGTPIVPILTPIVAPVKTATVTPIAKSLAIGSTGSDVLSLQTVLASQGLLNTYVKGVFGTSTEAAVKAFQKKYGIASSGNPSSTGYGAVGPKTRIRVNSLIPSTGVVKPVTPVVIPKPTTSTGASATTAFVPNPNSPYQRLLSLGAKGNDVKQLQIFLNTRGYTVAISGVGARYYEYTTFDTNTKNALMKFQTASGLKATGGLDGGTIKKIDSIMKY